MNRSTYGERDYAFGQAMLTLRTGIGLTQAGLADLLQVSRRAVAEWEAGSSYPTVGHLKHLIALGVRQQAFKAEGSCWCGISRATSSCELCGVTDLTSDSLSPGSGD